MVEEGYCEPGTVIVGSDSHSNSYGAVGAFGAGMGATDIAVALGLGRTWLRVPESIKVTFTGALRKGITMKDAIMRVVREIGTDGARAAGPTHRPPGPARGRAVVAPADGGRDGRRDAARALERGCGDRELRLRPVPRSDGRGAGRQRDLPLDGEPQLQGPDGLAGRRDLHRVAVRRGRRRAHGRHR